MGTQCRCFIPSKLMDGHDGKAMDVFVILMMLMDLVSMVMCATTKV